MLKFQSHGSKDLSELRELIVRGIYPSEFATEGDYAALGKIILHDQEPFSFVDAVYTYRQYLKDCKIYQNDPKLQNIIDRYTPEHLISIAFISGLQPIFCHSELNSPDISMLENQCLAIGCYYWYHAMIARDWFRHWQHHPELTPGDRSDAPKRFMLYARGLDGTRLYRQKFLEIMSPYQEQILYDRDRIGSISSDHSAQIDVKDANNAAIHIVLETLFETSKIHLTEKVFKPMAMSQPFFLLAGPGSLGYLRRYGFQTFGDFWDESYDLITDHDQRMERIKQEIAEISKLPSHEFQDLYRSMLPVIAHNRRWFFSEEFQDICINEMQDNFQLALESQWQNRMVYPGGTVAPLISELTKGNMFLGNDWPKNVKNFLNSSYLQIPKEKIIKTYPILTEHLV